MFQFQHFDRNGFNPLDDEGRKSKVKYLVLSSNAFSEAENFAILQTETEAAQMQLYSEISQAIN